MIFIAQSDRRMNNSCEKYQNSVKDQVGPMGLPLGRCIKSTSCILAGRINRSKRHLPRE